MDANSFKTWTTPKLRKLLLETTEKKNMAYTQSLTNSYQHYSKKERFISDELSKRGV